MVHDKLNPGGYTWDTDAYRRAFSELDACFPDGVARDGKKQQQQQHLRQHQHSLLLHHLHHHHHHQEPPWTARFVRALRSLPELRVREREFPLSYDVCGACERRNQRVEFELVLSGQAYHNKAMLKPVGDGGGDDVDGGGSSDASSIGGAGGNLKQRDRVWILCRSVLTPSLPLSVIYSSSFAMMACPS
jgi:hypothetical protein